MKLYVGFLFGAIFSALAYSSVGVVVGANKFSDDGFPMLKKNEQTKVFFCHAKSALMDGRAAAECALDKCKKYFKVPPGAKANGKKVIGGHCMVDSWIPGAVLIRG